MSAQPVLQDRVALVTGASRGIGFAVARAMARAGAHVIAVARTRGGLEELDDVITQEGGLVTLAPFDLAKLDQIDALVASIYQRFQRLDILVANAAQLSPLSPMSHSNPKDWEKTFAINVFAIQRLVRSCDAVLRKGDAGRALFSTCSIARDRKAFWSAYAASKSAMETLVHTYALEVQNTSLRVNLIDPGPVATGLRAAAYPGEDASALPRPKEVADMFVSAAAPSFDGHGLLIER